MIPTRAVSRRRQHGADARRCPLVSRERVVGAIRRARRPSVDVRIGHVLSTAGIQIPPEPERRAALFDFMYQTYARPGSRSRC